MKKMIVGMGIIGIVLVSLASAGLVGFLSNSVTGTIEVLGPVFYLDNSSTLEENSLLWNDDDVEEGEIDIRKNHQNKNKAVFYSELWGEQVDFYEHDFMVFLDIENKFEKICGNCDFSNGKGCDECSLYDDYNSYLEISNCFKNQGMHQILTHLGHKGLIGIEIWIADENGKSKHDDKICENKSVDFEILSSEEIEILCEVDDVDLSDLEEGSRLKLVVYDKTHPFFYETIYVNGYSRVEVVAI